MICLKKTQIYLEWKKDKEMLKEKFIILMLGFVFVFSMPANIAMAEGMTLAQAKSSGYIGEQANGLLGAVAKSIPEEADNLITVTNSKRMVKYKAIAAKNGQPVNQVQALAGKKLITQTPSGQYIQTASGTWIKKK